MVSSGVTIVLWSVAVVMVTLAGIMAASETAVLMLTSGRVHRLVETGARGAASLHKLALWRHRLRAVSSLASGLAFGAGVAAAAWSAYAEAGSAPEFGATLVLFGLLTTLVVYAGSQALPRTLAVANPEQIGLQSALLALTCTRALYPVARMLGAPWRWAVAVVGGERESSPWSVTPEWRAVDDEGSERDQAEEALMEAVSGFAEKVAREVMVPRTDMKALADTATVAEAVELIAATGFTRIPIYRESIDDVRGVVYAKDLLGILRTCELDRRVIELARTPYFVPETKPVEELMAELRRKTHIAIVADEYGGTAGLVTLEDLLEEIVGDISDEYDREEPLMVDAGDGRFVVDARLPVDDLNERFGTDIDTEADSVGGLFTEVAGRIPEQGESVEKDGLRLTVTSLEGTRIRQLEVEPAVIADEGDDDA
jgi:CBS domain containing-hemolysin-like protein